MEPQQARKIPIGVGTLLFGKVRLEEPLETVMPGTSQAEKWPDDSSEKRPAVVLHSSVSAPAAVSAPLEFRAIYERWFADVSRWVRAMGGPEAER